MSTLAVEEFERRLRGNIPWLEINRTGKANIAQDLDRAAAHIDQVGWVQFRNFDDVERPESSPCCAVGALNALTITGQAQVGWVSDVALVFHALYGIDLIELNDHEATRAEEVTSAMRQVALHIRTYLEATDV